MRIYQYLQMIEGFLLGQFHIPNLANIPPAFFGSYIDIVRREVLNLDHLILINDEPTRDTDNRLDLAVDFGRFIGSAAGPDYWRYVEEEMPPKKTAEQAARSGRNFGILQARVWNSEIAHQDEGYEWAQEVYPEIKKLSPRRRSTSLDPELRDIAERLFIERKLEEMNWDADKTADNIGIQRSHLYSKLAKWGREESGDDDTSEEG